MKLQITIDGKAYEVDVELMEEELPPQQAAAYPLTPPAAGAHVQSCAAGNTDLKVCRSPVTGWVIKVNVQPGQAVATGELMLVLEAMKMETNVTAPRAATVKWVHVKPGDPVKLNQALLECE